MSEGTLNNKSLAGTQLMTTKQLLVLLNNPDYKKWIIEDSDLSLLVTADVINKIGDRKIDDLDPEVFINLQGCAEYILETYSDTIASYSDKDDPMFPNPIHVNGIPGCYGVYIYGWGFDRFFDAEEDALNYAEKQYKETPKVFN